MTNNTTTDATRPTHRGVHGDYHVVPEPAAHAQQGAHPLQWNVVHGVQHTIHVPVHTTVGDGGWADKESVMGDVKIEEASGPANMSRHSTGWSVVEEARVYVLSCKRTWLIWPEGIRRAGTMNAGRIRETHRVSVCMCV